MNAGAGGTRRAVAAGALTLLSARFAVAALAIVFIAISTRILTLREMAVFAVLNSLCAVQAMICSLGLLTTCTRELPALMGRGDADGAARLLRTAMITNAVVSLVLAAVLAAAARPLSILFLKEATFAPALRVVAAGVFFWNLFEANQIFLVALQRFGPYGRANVVCAVAQRGTALALFALLSGSGFGLLGYIAGYAAGTLVGVAAQFRALRDLLARRSGFAPLPPLLRYSMPFYADGYMRYLYMQADQLLIAIFLSPEVLSLYFVAKRFAQYYQQIVASFVDPVLAKVGEIRARGREAVERSLRSASRYFALVFLPFSAGAAAVSALFLDLAGGAPYRQAAGVLALLSLAVAAYAAFNLVTGYVYMLGAPSDRLKHNMVTGISQLALMAALLAALAAAGSGPLVGAAAIATARAVSLLLGCAYAHTQLRRYIAPTYETRILPRAAGAALILALVTALPQLFLYHPAIVPLYAAAGTVLFVLAIRPAVRAEDLDLLGSLLQGRAAPLERLARRILGQRSAPPA